VSAEIQVTMALAVRKGGTMDGIDLGRFAITMTGGNILRNRQTVGTSEEALVLGDCGSGGWIIMVNHGPTNYVQVRGLSGQTPLVRMPVNEPWCGRLDATAVPTVQANTAACEVEYLLLEA
jgi:hypothetical protein